MTSLFEQSGGTYTMQGDYRLPNLTLPPKEKRPIGVWGQRRLRYLKQNRKVLYYNLLTSGKLYAHLSEVDKQAEDMFLRLVKDMAAKQGVSEHLKANAQMKWVQKMNNIRASASEIVYKELVYV